ncbi:MAG TPA: hypothetical protein VM327_01045 [Candidatus Thermoplasmatota archaeon]|nr:hypothetical protein [Candidatus Thermoplasmatota archaeon]
MKWMVSWSCVLAFVLAGCIGGDANDRRSESGTVPPSVVDGTGMITASGPVFALGGESLQFTVEDNVTLVFAEIVWEDEVQDLDLALASPSAGMTGNAQNFDHVASGGAPGSPDSPHSLTIVTPETGAWQASAFANGVGGMVEYRIVVTMFHGESAVPVGYSAL